MGEIFSRSLAVLSGPLGHRNAIRNGVLDVSVDGYQDFKGANHLAMREQLAGELSEHWRALARNLS